MATPQQCNSLTTFYLNNYQGKYGIRPTVNRNKARWWFDNILEDLSLSEVKGLIEYYFLTNSASRHSLEWFVNNYDKLIEKRAEYEKDKADREKLRRESAKRAEEWRKRQSGNNPSENSGSSLSE